MALQMLYQRESGGSTVPEVLDRFDPASLKSDDSVSASQARKEDKALAHAQALFEGTVEHLDEVDTLIRSKAEHWRLERMPSVDRNILRLAVFEFLYQLDVPKLVIINEAIELAKRFGSEDSGRFVNGLLDGLLKSQNFAGPMT
jgi:N utilization substance protein B